ncbi:P-loop containing nucleoside triphosphate hydrolase protein [Athelia psychrophila]|uniref:P-loop containing nucleoside triphosphate hydrolase protein n=1 Tax=Athelia psychrophila TaxID=1759441 RepID=A0A166CHI1_9AGAM|nr:P-loop containing nucleoside triphosphate hydrolase protein [Fibularhizoctonia sp. CBS 109695]
MPDLVSEIDMSRIDPEELLVDAVAVEPGDDAISVHNIDEAFLRGGSSSNAGDRNIQRRAPHSHRLNLRMGLSKPVQLRQHPHKYAQQAHLHRRRAAMEGYNVLIFAYGQIASGEMFTLSGDPNEPGIIPRAMRDAGPRVPPALQLPGDIQRGGPRPSRRVRGPTGADPGNGALAAVLIREEGNRRKTNRNWNKRSSRSHSVFRMVMESRERGLAGAYECAASPLSERAYHPEYEWALDDAELESPVDLRAVAGTRMVRDCRRGAGGGSTLSLMDLAGSGRATVIGTLAENAAKGMTDHVPLRNYKLTSLLQPSLSSSAITESTSTLLLAQRIKRAALKVEKKEIVDTDALLEGDADGGERERRRRWREVADMLDDSPAKMAIEMSMRMQVGPSVLKDEWSVVEADMSFEYHAPATGCRSSARGSGWGAVSWARGRRGACRLRILCASV